GAVRRGPGPGHAAGSSPGPPRVGDPGRSEAGTAAVARVDHPAGQPDPGTFPAQGGQSAGGPGQCAHRGEQAIRGRGRGPVLPACPDPDARGQPPGHGARAGPAPGADRRRVASRDLSNPGSEGLPGPARTVGAVIAGASAPVDKEKCREKGVVLAWL